MPPGPLMSKSGSAVSMEMSIISVIAIDIYVVRTM